MTREEFAAFTEQALEDVIRAAEVKCGRKLSRHVRFQWLGREPVDENVVEEIVSRVFVSPEEIYPCVDLGVAGVDALGKTLVVASISGHQPQPFGPNWTGRAGPYVFVVGAPLLNDRQVGDRIPKGVFGYSVLEFRGPRDESPGA